MKALLHCGNCHCFRISGGKNDREKPTSGCITVAVIGQLHMSICDSIGSNNDGKGMFRVVEQAFVGRDHRTDTKNGCAGGYNNMTSVIVIRMHAIEKQWKSKVYHRFSTPSWEINENIPSVQHKFGQLKLHVDKCLNLLNYIFRKLFLLLLRTTPFCSLKILTLSSQSERTYLISVD